MHKLAIVFVLVLVVFAPAGRAAAADGLVYRYYAGYGYRFQPLLSLGKLNSAVLLGQTARARRLADELLPHARRSGDALYWPYDFSFAGGPSPWTSGFTQAVAAEALARAGVLLDDPRLRAAGDASFRALRHGLVMPLGGGSWIREYSWTRQAILNAQLESLLALDAYASIVRTPAAVKLAAGLARAARTLLPQFDVRCWGLYQLRGAPADLHYQAYHVELLLRLAKTRSHEPVWRATYRRWAPCLHDRSPDRSTG
jgi:D-glucuronyl C5-epimerase C-terminus